MRALEAAAQRETDEETGLRVVRPTAHLGSVRQKSGKIVHAFWATVAPESAVGDRRARNAARRRTTENDVCRFYTIPKARELMISAQREFLERLEAVMGTR